MHQSIHLFPPRLRWIRPAAAAAILGLAVAAFGEPAFPLSDSSPDSEAFRQRFLASYGVNAAIEPSFQPEDRVLYESVLPFLREDPRRAIQEVEEALAESDGKPAFRFLLGNLHYELGEYERAAEELQRALAAFPDFRRAHRTLGLIHIQQANFPQAIESWQRVIALGGGDAQSYGLLAYAYLSEQHYRSALSAYRMARMFRPDSLDFRRGEAQSLMQTRQFEEAAALLDELIGEHPAETDFWLLQANLFLQMERYADAIANLEVVHSAGGGTIESRFMLGDLHLRDDNYRLGLDHYRQALEQAEFGEAQIPRAIQALRYLVDRGLMDEARQFQAALLPALPEDLEQRQRESLRFIEARMALETGDAAAAREQLETLVEQNPLHADGLILLADVYQQSGDSEQAIFYLERALAVPDRKAAALVALGRLEANRGHWRAALEHLRAARELEPGAGLDRYIEAIAAAARQTR